MCLAEVSGRLLHDFFLDEDGTRWGMVVTPSEDNYEVRLKEVPEGAEELFLEDKEITVRGELQGKSKPRLKTRIPAL